MKVCCYADLHGNLPETPECDLVIIAGDITPATFVFSDPGVQANWLNTDFAKWTRALPCKDMVYIAGNHDWAFLPENEGLIHFDKIKGNYLYNSSVTINGVNIWGSPWTTWFHDWAFNFSPGQKGIEEAKELWGTIPENTNIVVTHGPPFGYGDKVKTGYRSDTIRVGDVELLDRIKALLDCHWHVSGHIHEGHGARRIQGTNNKWAINATHVDDSYVATFPPILMDFPTNVY